MDEGIKKAQGNGYMKPEKPYFQKIMAKARESILNFDSTQAESAVVEAVDAGIDPVDLIELGFVEGMKEMGDRYEKGDVPLGYIIAASRIMEKGLSMIRKYTQDKHMDVRMFGNIAIKG